MGSNLGIFRAIILKVRFVAYVSGQCANIGICNYVSTNCSSNDALRLTERACVMLHTRLYIRYVSDYEGIIVLIPRIKSYVHAMSFAGSLIYTAAVQSSVV